MMPAGLRKPHHYLQLAPILIAFLLVCAFAALFVGELARMG